MEKPSKARGISDRNLNLLISLSFVLMAILGFLVGKKSDTHSVAALALAIAAPFAVVFWITGAIFWMANDASKDDRSAGKIMFLTASAYGLFCIGYLLGVR